MSNHVADTLAGADHDLGVSCHAMRWTPAPQQQLIVGRRLHVGEARDDLEYLDPEARHIAPT